MGLFDKLFGGKNEKKKETAIDTLPRENVTVEGKVSLIVKETNAADMRMFKDVDKLKEHMDYTEEFPDQDTTGVIGVEYKFDLEYVVTNQRLFDEILEVQPVEEALNDAFWMHMSETKKISITDLDQPSEDYMENLRTDFNFSYKDWGIACTGLKVFYFTADEESKAYCDMLKKTLICPDHGIK